MKTTRVKHRGASAVVVDSSLDCSNRPRRSRQGAMISSEQVSFRPDVCARQLASFDASRDIQQ